MPLKNSQAIMLCLYLTKCLMAKLYIYITFVDIPICTFICINIQKVLLFKSIK